MSAKYLDLALAQARLGLPVSNNPSVGCVIVAPSGYIISVGHTGQNGSPHAEAVAISNANSPLEGAIMYVTLEPCSHEGHNPPCVNAIISSGISKVVIGIRDPDDRVDGVLALENAGISVEVSNCPKIAFFYRDYIYYKTYQRPYITAKLALSVGGSSSTSRQWVSSPKTRSYTNLLRGLYDGIAVGRGTFESDSPRLDCRVKGLEDFSPRRFLISSSTSKFSIDGFEVLSGTDSIAELYEQGIRTLLVEGGINLVNSILDEGLVNELIVVHSGLISDQVTDMLCLPKDFCHILLVDSQIIDNDIIARYIISEST